MTVAHAVFVSLMLLFLGCEEKIRPTVLPGIDPGSLPLQESWNSTVTLSDSGMTRAIINAGYIRVYEEPRHTLFSEGVVVDFFDKEGRATSTLTSRQAKVDDRTNDLEAWGEVVVVSRTDSTVLRTERLFWDNRKRLVHTPDFVAIASPTERIQGTGFEAEENLRNYRIFRVSGETQAQ